MGPRQRKHQANKDATSVSKDTISGQGKAAEQNSVGQHGVLWRKVLTRVLLSILMIFVVYYTSNKETEKVFASREEKIQQRTQEVQCDGKYQKEVSKFKGCAPANCGRLVTDLIVSETEAGHLLRIAKKGLAFGGSGGGASILDLHSGALSQGNVFINIYREIKSRNKNDIFTRQDFQVYKNVKNKIQQMIAFSFGIEANKLYLTHPTFFSEMTARAAQTVHDEYWHVHVDKETYPSFHYTSLLYLSNYETDFTGGRFVFVDKPVNVTVEPKLGRVSVFTSGSENPHYVEKVKSGTRYALTVSFTCDKNSAIEDPSIKKLL